MPFKIEFDGDTVVEWHATPDGVERTEISDYTPTVYVHARPEQLATLEAALQDDPKIAGLATEEWYTSLDADTREPVLRVDLHRVSEVSTFAREVRLLHKRGEYAPGTFRLYNVDFSPQFRYCLETQSNPVPERDLSILRLGITEKPLANSDISSVAIVGDPVQGDEPAVLRAVQHRVAQADPDVLLLSHGGLVPLCFEKAATYDIADFALGREPGFEQLAGQSTYESYGRVGHSPARFDVPGRVVLDESNSFLWGVSNLAGLLDLVERSWKPLQEAGWASIGNVLTAIQIRYALDRDVLISWNKWEPEAFKDLRTLHTADRGGFTFAPQVGLHEDVAEIDFASLYPNIICQYNISPDAILCDCHADRADIPEIGYNVCDEPGFLAEVLQPLLNDRADIKARLPEVDDDKERADLEATSSAIKWILVSCFGYQGYRNSKFGRIECHEAINAVARDILLTAKEILEAGGWEIVHGIVDSLWVTPAEGREETPLQELTAEISEQVDIRLEFEGRYEWVCFVPRRDSEAGALTKYFGKLADADEFKVRGIEARQRSTPAYVEACQEELMDVLDAHREPGPVIDRLQRQLQDLQQGHVDPQELVIRKRASKQLGEYSQSTQTVAALERAQLHDMERFPGQSIQYIVVDDDASQTRERVRLPFEHPAEYDAEFYTTLLVRAAESVVSPLGWDRTRIRRYLRSDRDLDLAAFT